MIILSVCTVSVLGMLSFICEFSVVSSCFNIASCSAWLLDHFLCSLFLN